MHECNPQLFTGRSMLQSVYKECRPVHQGDDPGERQARGCSVNGFNACQGQIRVVLNGQDHVVIHHTSGVKTSRPVPGAIEAIDFAYSEVATDTERVSNTGVVSER